MPLGALPDDAPLHDVHSGKQVGSAVPTVVVSLPLGHPGSEGKDRLGSVEGLDLGPFVNAEHESVLREIEAEADHVPQLLLKVAIGAPLVEFESVGLQSSGLPDARHGVGTNPLPGRHQADRSLGRVVRLGVEGIVDDRPDLRVRQRSRPPGSGSVLLDAGEKKASESAPPESIGVAPGVQLRRDLFVRESVGSAEDDLGPEHDAKGGGPTSSPGLELTTLFGGERDRWSDPHRGRKGSPAFSSPIHQAGH